jgi:4-methyl-5(b-hydroxyethyl)-thiazole monophosphate biosynthesis
MEKIYTFLAPGLEETEAVTVIDLLRRADIEVVTLGLGGREVQGSHGITIIADEVLEEKELADDDGLFLPGGMPGTINLRENPTVQRMLRRAEKNNNLVAAICAAPTAFEVAGVARGIRLTSHPSVKDFLIKNYDYSEQRVVVSGNWITGRGVGTAIEFALKLVEILVSPEKAEEIKKAIVAE